MGRLAQTLDLMLAKLTAHQLLILAAVASVWGLVLFWICKRKPETATEDRFSKFIEWRIYQNKPHGTVDDWIGATTKQKGAPGPMSRSELAWAWTAMAGVVASYLMFEWTRVV